MKRRPIHRRSDPIYPDRWTARVALGLLALSTAALTGCDASPEPNPQGQDKVAPPGAMPEPHVDGDPVMPDAEPVIPEVGEEPVELEEIEGDVAVPHPTPIPGGIRAPDHPGPTTVEDAAPRMPGSMPMPVEVETTAAPVPPAPTTGPTRMAGEPPQPSE